MKKKETIINKEINLVFYQCRRVFLRIKVKI